MIQWLFYACVVSTLLSVSGIFAEQALRSRRLPTRSIWLLTLLLSAWLSLQALPTPAPLRAPSPVAQSASPARAALPIPLPNLSNTALRTVSTESLSRVQAVLPLTWLALSALVLLGLTASGILVYRRRRRWPMHLIDTHCVGVSDAVGPAVIGLIRPTIVLPAWVLNRPAGEQRLILAHEASHMRARDPLLLTVALLPVLLLPWNPLLWWQLHRLRHAIEVDCDARVLAAGNDLSAYGEALIAVGQRKSRTLGAVAAMSENRTLLEKRIELMSLRIRKPWTLGFAALFALSLSVALAATQVTSPDATSATGLTLDVATLNRYVGPYQMGPTSLLTISREGTQLKAAITGQPTFPIYADSPSDFHWAAVPATVTFSGDSGGLASTATIHQNGATFEATRLDAAAASQLERQLADRIAAGQPQPGSEAALKRTVAAMLSGSPNYADMIDALQSVVRRQEPGVSQFLTKLGAARTIEFRGVADSGADKYLVSHAGGKQTQWIVGLDASGRISTLAVAPAF